MVGRDSTGSIVAWQRRRVPYIRNPEIGEVLAARQAASLAMELGIRHVVIEGDCLNVIRALQDNVEDFSAIGSFLQDIKHCCSFFTSFSFAFVPRSGNTLAHSLSRNVLVDSDGESSLPVDVL